MEERPLKGPRPLWPRPLARERVCAPGEASLAPKFRARLGARPSCVTGTPDGKEPTVKKNLVALLSFALLGTGCTVPVESADEYEEIDEAAAEVTSFFDTGENDPALCPNGTPYVKGPYMNNGNLLMQSGGSCATMPGATLTVQVPFSVTTYGPYSIGWDSSGAALRVPNMGGAIPPGSCRMLTITNTTGAQSSPKTFCR